MDYTGYKVVQFPTPNTEGQRLIEEHFADVWEINYDSTLVLADPSLLSDLESAGVEFNVTIDDVQSRVSAEQERLNSFSTLGTTPASVDAWFDEYHTYDDAKVFLEQQCNESRLCTWIPSIGQSWEGRDIFAMRITRGSGKRKPKVFFQGQQHSREWISTPTVQYIALNLIGQYRTNRDVRKSLNDYEYIIVPIVNPDGYVYSWTDERFWRKNRRDNGDGSFGVDTNRNWDSNWAGCSESPCASPDPSSNVYHGPSVFSEPETAAVRDFLAAEEDVIVGIDWHSFSQLILRAPGDSNEPTIHEDLLTEAGQRQADIIKSVSGKIYRNIPSIQLYPTTGTAGDYFYAREYTSRGCNKPRNVYGYTYELRPDDIDATINDFILPPEEIKEVGAEVFPAILDLSSFAEKNPLYLTPLGDDTDCSDTSDSDSDSDSSSDDDRVVA